MACVPLAAFAQHFADLEDPRLARTRFHPLTNVLVIGLCAVICGVKHFTQMEVFGKAKKDWLARFLDLRSGIPSHDTFNAVFTRLHPAAFEQALLGWITALHEVTDGQILAIDGKTLRGSYRPGESKALIHMVSIWATANHLSLGSTVVDEKSNEITAIPRLLELIDVSGALVTIDAMGCQKEIAQKILDADADYVLAVKDNQPTLNAAIGAVFTEQVAIDVPTASYTKYHTEERSHGRVDERNYFVCPVPEDFPVLDQWPGLKALGVVIHRTERDGQEHWEIGHYILSKKLAARRFAEAVRGHWGIENNLHWQLEVTFREDDLRVHKGHAPTNLSILMRAALGLLKNETSQASSIESKRLTAGWNEEYLEKVLTNPKNKVR
jgi:predicted transposase YbfD/YdcC